MQTNKRPALDGLTPKDKLILSWLAIDSADKGELSPEMVKELAKTAIELNKSRLLKGKGGNEASNG